MLFRRDKEKVFERWLVSKESGKTKIPNSIIDRVYSKLSDVSYFKDRSILLDFPSRVTVDCNMNFSFATPVSVKLFEWELVKFLGYTVDPIIAKKIIVEAVSDFDEPALDKSGFFTMNDETVLNMSRSGLIRDTYPIEIVTDDYHVNFTLFGKDIEFNHWMPDNYLAYSPNKIGIVSINSDWVVEKHSANDFYNKARMSVSFSIDVLLSRNNQYFKLNFA